MRKFYLLAFIALIALTAVFSACTEESPVQNPQESTDQEAVSDTGEIETPPEAPTEAPTEPETEPVTEPDTDPETSPEIQAPVTQAPEGTDEPATEAETSVTTDAEEEPEVRIMDDSLFIWILIAIMIVAVLGAAAYITVETRK
jgi:outer membrane biosynthesis protein TonB